MKPGSIDKYSSTDNGEFRVLKQEQKSYTIAGVIETYLAKINSTDVAWACWETREVMFLDHGETPQVNPHLWIKL